MGVLFFNKFNIILYFGITTVNTVGFSPAGAILVITCSHFSDVSFEGSSLITKKQQPQGDAICLCHTRSCKINPQENGGCQTYSGALTDLFPVENDRLESIVSSSGI